MAETKQPAPTTSPAPQRNPLGFLLMLVAIGFVLFVLSRSHRSEEPQFAGMPLPPLEVAGWFNAPPTCRGVLRPAAAAAR